MSMSEETSTKIAVGFWWVVSLLVVFGATISYTGSSQQAVIDSKTAEIATLKQEVASLTPAETIAPVAEPEPTTTVDIEPVQSSVCAVTLCNDGSCSISTGRGTCSHHGGVDRYY